jgi:3-oxoacyl-[acyl-carrier-protein] synthase-3
MAEKRAGFLGIGSYLPDKILTNADLEKMVDTSDEWIITRTGIRERRMADGSTATSDLAVHAARRALAGAKLEPKDLELIIVATITPDMLFPSTACLVQENIGASNAACFDVSAACTGFIYSLSIAKNFIENGTYNNVLVIGAEKLSSITDWTDRNTCVLFGDGAGAAVLGAVSTGGILGTFLGSDGTASGLLKVPAGGSRNPASHKTVDEKLHFLKMSGNEVFKLAVKMMAEAAEKVISDCHLTCEDIACFIPHQANIRIIEAVSKKLKISPDKIFLNIEKYGNMSSASTIVALDEAVRAGRIKKGDAIVLVAFGSGLTYGACVIQW